MWMQSSSDSGRVAYCHPIGITSSKTKCVRVRNGVRNGRSLQHPKQISDPAILMIFMRNAQLNNRGKLIKSVILQLANKQGTKRNKTGLSVVDLKNFRASKYLEKAHFIGLKVLARLIFSCAINLDKVRNRAIGQTLGDPGNQVQQCHLLQVGKYLLDALNH